jgi:thiamine biosynthesis lipoprotein
MPDDWNPLWSIYKNLYSITNGTFTPLVGSLLEDLGYGAEYSLRKKRVLRPVLPLEIITYSDSLLRITKPVLLDIGAAGKGYLVDIVCGLLKENGITAYTVNAGGDISHFGGTQLRVGLEDPQNMEHAIGFIELSNESLCGSAGNRRRLGEDHHIVNPKTAKSPKHISAVWVLASSTLIADALATALYFTDPKTLLRQYSFDWVILASDRSVRFSRRFEKAFF